MVRRGQSAPSGPSRAGKTGRAKPSVPTAAALSEAASNIPLTSQQQCLELFRNAFQPSADDKDILQQVKASLFDRKFAAAFGKEEYLRVYASRWSPSRALGYFQILTDLSGHLTSSAVNSASDASDGGVDLRTFRAVCIGGGAGAEIVALAAWTANGLEHGRDLSCSTIMVDIASWQSVVDALHARITTPPELSQYASAAAKEANKAMLDADRYCVSFLQRDALDWTGPDLTETVRDTNLVTLMFTLNELYSTSVAKTQQFLAMLTSGLRTGALLLVVDSPGSYSTVSINGAEKKYPMQWLLDHTLIGSPAKTSGNGLAPKWEKIVSDESRWFRMPEGLQYPIDLENMRYQIHLYRRLPD